MRPKDRWRKRLSRTSCGWGRGESPAVKGVGFSVKVAILMILVTVGGTAAWRLWTVRLGALRDDGANRRAARQPLGGAGAHQGVPAQGADLPPPIVPSEFGPGTSPDEGSAQTAVEQAREPWAHVLAAAGPPPPFEEACFDDVSADHRGLKPGELRRWLQSQPDGSLKLLSPWPANAALRLAFYPREPFRIHIFGGEGAVTLGIRRAAAAVVGGVCVGGQPTASPPRAGGLCRLRQRPLQPYRLGADLAALR